MRRSLVLAAIPLVALVAFVLLGPIPQPVAYHRFADQRMILGIENFCNVVSNVPFFLIAAYGLWLCMKLRPPGARWSWVVLYGGFFLTGAGSSFYHFAPDNSTLVWDRLPMTIAFAAVYAALLSEFASEKLEYPVLSLALACGIASVLYWAARDDLGPYFAVQATLFASAAFLLWICPDRFKSKIHIAAGFGFYALAVGLEHLDRFVFSLTDGLISGHTLKHIFIALAIYVTCRMLVAREMNRSPISET